MEDQIVPADKKLRKLVLVAAVLVAAVGLPVLAVLHGYLREIENQAQRNPQAAVQKAICLTAIVAWVGGLGFVGAGLRLFRLGRRINRADRFPPPGMKVIKNTPVRTGAKARALANLAQVAALLCVVVGTVGMCYLYRLAVTVLQQ